MKRIAYWAVSAALAGLGIAGCDKNDQANKAKAPDSQAPNAVERATDKTVDVAKNVGEKTADVISNATTRVSNLGAQSSASVGATTRGTSNLLASANSELMLSAAYGATKDATSKGGFASVIKDFTKRAQKRMGDPSKINSSEIDGIIMQIQGDWKAKYGGDFKIPADLFTPNNFVVLTNNSSGGNGGLSNTNGGVGIPNGTVMGQTDMGQAGGVVSIPAQAGAGEIAIAVIQEGVVGPWRIEPPSTLTAQKLHDNLLKELTAIKDGKDTWPGDQSAGYRAVVGRVMSALADKPM